jgi:hypothetical protein
VPPHVGGTGAGEFAPKNPRKTARIEVQGGLRVRRGPRFAHSPPLITGQCAALVTARKQRGRRELVTMNSQPMFVHLASYTPFQGKTPPALQAPLSISRGWLKKKRATPTDANGYWRWRAFIVPSPEPFLAYPRDIRATAQRSL